VKVAYPGGEMSFMGFTGRSLIRYAYDLEGLPVLDGPSWLDTKSMEFHAETSAVTPEDFDFREAIRVALEGQYGISIRRESRLFPVFGLQPVSRGTLGPNIRPATADCIEDLRTRPDVLGPSLHGRGELVVPFCGIDNTIKGPKGYRVTLTQFARSLRGFNMGPADGNEAEREVVDQTGLTGEYDFILEFASLTEGPRPDEPLPDIFVVLQEQLGLKLEPIRGPVDVLVIDRAELPSEN